MLLWLYDNIIWIYVHSYPFIIHMIIIIVILSIEVWPHAHVCSLRCIYVYFEVFHRSIGQSGHIGIINIRIRDIYLSIYINTFSHVCVCVSIWVNGITILYYNYYYYHWEWQIVYTYVYIHIDHINIIRTYLVPFLPRPIHEGNEAIIIIIFLVAMILWI